MSDLFSELLRTIAPQILQVVATIVAILIALYLAIRVVIRRVNRPQLVVSERKPLPTKAPDWIDNLDAPDGEEVMADRRPDELPDVDMLLGITKPSSSSEPPPEEPKPWLPPKPERPAPPRMPEIPAVTDTQPVATVRQLNPITDDQVVARLHTGRPALALELIRILRDEYDGRLMVQIGDTVYRTLKESPEALAFFSEIMKELSNVITSPDETVPPTGVLRDIQARATPPPSSPPSPAPAVPAPPKAPDAPVVPGALPSYKLDDVPQVVTKKGFGRARLEYAEVPEFDIPKAIDSYLQYRLEGSAYHGRYIRIRNNGTGGIRVFVDDQQYEAIDDIVDVEIREFIRASIDEWQARQ
jgi:hypothetical protein